MYEAEQKMAGMSRGMDSPVQIAPPGPIRMGLAELRGSVGDLAGYVNRLEDRVSPICTPKVAADGRGPNGPDCTSSSPLGDEIAQVTYIVNDLRRRIGSMMDSMEL